MGFEQDYERELRNPVWGKPLRNFRQGLSADDIRIVVLKALAYELRHGRLSEILPLAGRFRDAFEQAVNPERTISSVKEATEIYVFRQFQLKCSDLVLVEDRAVVVELFCSKAAEYLFDVACNPNAFSHLSPIEAATALTTSFLERVACDQLNIAAEVCSRKTCESPDAVEDRLKSALDTERIRRMVLTWLKDETKTVRVPSRRRPGVCLRESLL